MWRKILVCIVFLFVALAPVTSSTASLPEQAVIEAYKYQDLKERTNKNDHPQIDLFLKYLGLPPKLPWCAAFTLYCYKEAAEELNVKQPLPKYGRVSTLWSFCKRTPSRCTTFTVEQVRLGLIQLRPGDMPIWKHGVSNQDNFNGHIGLTIEQLSNTKIKTIEGNTLPETTGNAGNQREGGGVYIRTRYLVPGSFKIIGFIRVK